MDPRRHARLEAAGPVRVTILGDTRRQVAGRVADFSGGGLKLILEEPVPAGTALMVEWDNSEILGEVCWSRPELGGYAAGVQIEHTLVDTRELARLASRLLGETEPAPVRDPS